MEYVAADEPCNYDSWLFRLQVPLLSMTAQLTQQCIAWKKLCDGCDAEYTDLWRHFSDSPLSLLLCLDQVFCRPCGLVWLYILLNLYRLVVGHTLLCESCFRLDLPFGCSCTIGRLAAEKGYDLSTMRCFIFIDMFRFFLQLFLPSMILCRHLLACF